MNVFENYDHIAQVDVETLILTRLRFNTELNAKNLWHLAFYKPGFDEPDELSGPYTTSTRDRSLAGRKILSKIKSDSRAAEQMFNLAGELGHPFVPRRETFYNASGDELFSYRAFKEKNSDVVAILNNMPQGTSMDLITI
ncbi:hypothetical protein IAQ61_011885 [Plenodomus lingam]|uniref:uncharacterized protein n=1 Tax=Leptosphaeria maculans TaxID=5022 RepID=UPI0033229E88|nr:hypothetical protein IAQ61_011885 [Plenodomus lingam]